LNFIIDGMLGKLTIWLRMMGHDAKYSTVLSDDELLTIGKDEKRVLLTRDLELYQRAISKGSNAYYVEGETESERLAELSSRYGINLDIDMTLSRCPKCNTRLTSVNKEAVAAKLEKNTLLHYNEFWSCKNCGSVYWQGSHWTKIKETLEAANKKLDTQNIA
jgi:uncharacterized protein